jgi:hypothetical protein
VSPEESVENRLRNLEQAIWGIRGENGLTQQLKGLRHDISDWRKEDVSRREAVSRALSIALLAATVALIGTVATLVTVLSSQ